MATTSAAIRDEMITLLQALTPLALAATPYRVHREAGDFRQWAVEHANACMRRFSVRDNFIVTMPDVTGLDLEWVQTTFTLVVAYPATYRAGADGMRDSDDLIEKDMHQIDGTIGTRGYGNYTAGTVTTESMGITESDEVRLLEMDFLVRYYRAV